MQPLCAKHIHNINHETALIGSVSALKQSKGIESADQQVKDKITFK